MWGGVELENARELVQNDVEVIVHVVPESLLLLGELLLGLGVAGDKLPPLLFGRR